MVFLAVTTGARSSMAVAECQEAFMRLLMPESLGRPPVIQWLPVVRHRPAGLRSLVVLRLLVARRPLAVLRLLPVPRHLLVRRLPTVRRPLVARDRSAVPRSQAVLPLRVVPRRLAARRSVEVGGRGDGEHGHVCRQSFCNA